MRESSYTYYHRRPNKNYARTIAIIRRRKLVLALGILFSILFIFMFTCSMRTNAQDSRPRYKYFTGITVESGDTLWNICEDHMSYEYSDIREYVAEVISLNHLPSDGRLKEGQLIIIPYYSYENLS